MSFLYKRLEEELENIRGVEKQPVDAKWDGRRDIVRRCEDKGNIQSMQQKMLVKYVLPLFDSVKKSDDKVLRLATDTAVVLAERMHGKR